MNKKVELFINKSKLALSKAGKFLASTEGQALVTGLEWGVIIGAIIVRRQDAKALGLTTKELVTKVKEFRAK